MPTNANEMKALLDKANSLPLRPGVYIMKGVGGNVIYVGKSRKLKNRVSQYFRNGEKNTKTAAMVAHVKDFEYFLCDTEIEALTLENTLIKQYDPKYNIRLKDAKSYPYIKITDGEYPRLVMTRKRENDKGRYFGPYSGVSTVYSVINMLSGALGLPTCKRRFPRDIGKERPCIYYQMNKCMGVCTGNVDREEYNVRIRQAADVLRGNTKEVKRELTEKMGTYAENEQYELAAKCRDVIFALDKLSQKQKVVAAPDVEYDMIGLYSDDTSSAVCIFYVRNGALTDKSVYAFGSDRILDEENISSLICEHYKMREYIPKEILLSFPLEDDERQLISDYLSSLSSHRVALKTPERGALKTLAEMAKDNAYEVAKQYKEEKRKDEEVLLRLAHLLRLDVYPQRIECYDISNIGHEHITAGMIVTDGIKFKKSDYRYFKIKTVRGTTDDYASMREALERRFAHIVDDNGSFSNYPDLILLDGGKGHVSVVRDVLSNIGVDVPVFGMVKDEYHKTRALCSDTEEISIAKENSVFMFIYRLQEEVHRFTVSRMDAQKRKTLKKSTLTNIKGIGDAKARALFMHFGSISAIKGASADELCKVKGISASDAESIINYYKKKET